MNRNLMLAVALLLIGGAIYALENQRAGSSASPGPLTPGEAPAAPPSSPLSPYPRAPELRGIAGVINAGPNVSLASLRGQVVLVDFWTYTCINCQRTLPYLTAWDRKYRDQGLAVIGVHTPEFEFEKNLDNVKRAVAEHRIEYPVVQDNDYATWRVYKNNYWPRKYLVDAEGNIRYDHIGEGAYEETEQWIQRLLEERNRSLRLQRTTVASELGETRFASVQTPELYLGTNFARAPLGNPEGFQPGRTVAYTMPPAQESNLVYLEGTWTNHPDHMELASDSGRVVLRHTARSVNIVAGGNASLRINLDGKDLGPSAGRDIAPGSNATRLTIQAERLYNLVNTDDYATRLLQFRADGRGFRLYTFTFG
ncbi:MAG: thioredoxin family protein [Euryarchaeota archaeon]|nr:thioredoxin family protein [Euryarchaeota archaeon]